MQNNLNIVALLNELIFIKGGIKKSRRTNVLLYPSHGVFIEHIIQVRCETHLFFGIE